MVVFFFFFSGVLISNFLKQQLYKLQSMRLSWIYVNLKHNLNTILKKISLNIIFLNRI